MNKVCTNGCDLKLCLRIGTDCLPLCLPPLFRHSDLPLPVPLRLLAPTSLCRYCFACSLRCLRRLYCPPVSTFRCTHDRCHAFLPSNRPAFLLSAPSPSSVPLCPLRKSPTFLRYCPAVRRLSPPGLDYSSGGAFFDGEILRIDGFGGAFRTFDAGACFCSRGCGTFLKNTPNFCLSCTIIRL